MSTHAAVLTASSTESDPAVTETHRIRSHLFGEVECADAAIMRFTSPLWGFPGRHRYALLPAPRQGLFWLQAVDDEVITFILADPFTIDEAYAVDLSETDRRALRATSKDDVLVLVMLTLPNGDGGEVTANFRAPLVFNLREGAGVQVVTSDDAHPLRRPVSLAVFPAGDGVALG